MPFRVEIALKSGYRDATGEGIRNSIKNSLGIGVDDVRTIKVYTVNAALTDEEKKAIAGGPFSDAIVQRYAIDTPLASGFDWLVEVGFRPGVTDNEGKHRQGGYRGPPRPQAGSGRVRPYFDSNT